MITLKDIAREAGVSTRSVSVVLNGKAEESRISPAVAQRIERIAKKLNYTPNPMARAVRTKKTFQVGVLVSELSNPYTGANIEAIERNLIGHGYKLLLGLTNRNVAVAKAYLNEFSRGAVDGILNLDPTVGAETFAQLKISIPHIHFLRNSPDFELRVDFRQGINLALDHLWGLGHRRIGFLSGPKGDLSGVERLEAFQLYFREGKGAAGKSLVQYGDWTFASGQAQAGTFLQKGFSAIVGSNDLMAIGAMKFAQAAGYQVPRRISVVGFDDSSVAMMAEPPLTSVHIPTAEAARLSVEALLYRISKKPVKEKKHLVRPSLAVRASSGPVAHP